MPNEPKVGETDGASVDQYGAMLGMRMTIPMTEGYFYGNAEAVYLSPYLYHRAIDGANQNLYFVSSTRVYQDGVRGIFRYLSFPFGSDAIAATVKAGYRKPGDWSFELSAFAMAHGVIDKYSNINETQSADQYTENKAPSTENIFGSDAEQKGGVVEYTLDVGADGSKALSN